jgi:hypothetical protein
MTCVRCPRPSNFCVLTNVVGAVTSVARPSPSRVYVVLLLSASVI